MNRLRRLIALVFLILPLFPGSAPAASLPDITPSDYSARGNWMFLAHNAAKPVDIFYLYPTAWAMEQPGQLPLCPIDYMPMRNRAREIGEFQAAPFAQAGNLFAPFYRQLDAKATLLAGEEDMAALLSIPGMDVTAAFDYYLNHYNGGRPFILVGHSQGASMVKILLFEYLRDHPKANELLVAAYVLGFAVTREELAANPHTRFASGPDDLGVIISYNTEAPRLEGRNPTLLPGALAINPITWTRGPEPAPAALNLGSLIMRNGRYRKIMNLADARLDLERGTVICSSADPEEFSMPPTLRDLFPLGVYHMQDIGFYYYNLRENALRRAENYLDARSAANGAPF